MKHLTDAQQQLVITTIAKVPVPEARPILLAKLGRRLPDTRVSDEQLLEAINSAVASFPPGAYVADEHGAWRAWDYIDPARTLKEAADAYLRQLAINRGTEKQVCWPPIPPRPPMTPEQAREAEQRRAERMRNSTPQELREAANEYIRALGGTPREEPEIVELSFDLTQPPPERPVPVVVDEPNLVEIMPQDTEIVIDEREEEPPSPYFSDWGAPGRDNRGRPLKSAYAEVSELSKRRKRGGLRRLRDISKVFFK